MAERRNRAPRPWLRVRLDETRGKAYVSGAPGTKALLVEAGERKPYWLGGRKAWGTTATIAGDLLALAQRDGWAVAFERVGGEDR